MKRTRTILVTEIAAFIIITLIIICLYESHVFLDGAYTNHQTAEFVLVTSMEMLTLCSIPLALRLFKFKRISGSLKENGTKALLKWGSLRIFILVVPMLLNVIFYYLFENVAFGYMAIIIFLCLFFIYPTKNRCEIETEK